MESLDIYLKQVLSYFNFSSSNSLILIRIFLPIIMVGIGYIVKFSLDFFLKSTVFRMIHHSKTNWDDQLISSGFFQRVTRFIPFIILYHSCVYLFSYSNTLSRLVQNIALTYIAWNTLKIISLVLKVFEEFTSQLDSLKGKPIKSYTQVVKILCYLVFFIVIISIFLQKSPLGILSGIGALTAIILLVFKDSILGFVASIQIASYDMVHKGDWIQMDQFNADGDVLDITLNHIKVQNWDKTITTIPTYSLVAGTFKNWRGMKESGGRRIKRSLFIDISSVHFCDKNLLEKLKKIDVLKSYLIIKEDEIKIFNEKHKDDTSIVNLRKMTNIGSFRVYIREYLKKHPLIRQDMTLLVRQLQPEEQGIPIEVYCFTNTVEWVPYEEIQSDIFDHLLGVIPEFELRIYQKPTGNDVRRLFNESE
jgi:miniconductance mechanosensitive channel